jgi:hypothetical protein
MPGVRRQHIHRDLWLVVVAVAMTLAGGTPPAIWIAQKTVPSAHLSLWPNSFMVAAAIVFAFGLYVFPALLFGWWLPGGFKEPELPRPAGPVHSPTFWDVKGGTVSGDIRNTYNAPADGKDWDGTLVRIEPGMAISDIEGNFEFGSPSPRRAPDQFASTADERIRLRDQLLDLAGQVDAVMAPWAQSPQAVAQQMGMKADEFMARMSEILSERSRIDAGVTARYNAECRSAVIQACGHARSIGFADAETERLWHTTLGAGASKIPALLRGITVRIPD